MKRIAVIGLAVVITIFSAGEVVAANATELEAIKLVQNYIPNPEKAGGRVYGFPVLWFISGILTDFEKTSVWPVEALGWDATEVGSSDPRYAPNIYKVTYTIRTKTADGGQTVDVSWEFMANLTTGVVAPNNDLAKRLWKR